ncbi:YdcF family protein [Aquibacillus koreensis]|uniref:YdcF family protein n=1 Tax=Aquibacillus koreensis TaxID=279446 RepID=A0A9X3WJK3_9BACI|nr:YdcF family protein [Aquibacillus koreensis]MCT2537706.1 YdcF family protein [Aquibacillus koreensis]MDC3420947.1 YdcF family protein [Aquibacillus koreensis]
MESRKTFQRLKRLLLGFILAGALLFIIQSVVIVVDGLHDETSKTDVGVVLGNKVNLDGSPSDRLKARLDKALELYEDDRISHVITSGGIGDEGFDEAKVMKDFLVENGVEEEHVITDSEGYNTFMTAENARKIMDDNQWTSATVITQYFHITRSKLAFDKQGIEQVNGAHADFFELRDFYSIFREFFAVYKYLLK